MIVFIAFRAMLAAIALLVVLPTLVVTSGGGNIHLLEDEVANALRSCYYNESTVPARIARNIRSSSFNEDDQNQQGRQIPRIDNVKQYNSNLYSHERRNSTDQMYVLNGTQKDIAKDGRTETDTLYVRTATLPSQNDNSSRTSNSARPKRSATLIKYSNQDQCLSQCVFANLQVVDVRGIPREAELWNKVQSTLASQQSRVLLKDQIQACFRELQSAESEDEDNGCSYSNKLERCLMLRFSDRKLPK